MAIQTVHVSKWTAKNTKADGTPLTGKFGPYWMVGIQTTEEEGWRNGFINGSEKPEDWTGKEIALELFETDKDGKTYKNFRLPKKSSQELAEMDAKIETALNKIVAHTLELAALRERIDTLEGKKKDNYPKESNKTAFDEGELQVEDLPF